MDSEKIGEGCAGLEEHAAGHVGLVITKGLGHSHFDLFNPAFFSALQAALAVPSAPGCGLPCFLRSESLID